MPWCEECSKFWNPPSLGADGSCPSCGHVIAVDESASARSKVPWHFKLLLVLVAVYLGWRLIQLVTWLF